MSTIHDRVMVALAESPGKQRTVAEITRFVNKHFRYSKEDISDALVDLMSERVVEQHDNGRWMVADNRKRGSSRHETRHPYVESSLVKRVNKG